MEYVVILFVFAVACGAIAQHKGRSPVLWGTVGLLTGCVGLIICLFLPRKQLVSPVASFASSPPMMPSSLRSPIPPPAPSRPLPVASMPAQNPPVADGSTSNNVAPVRFLSEAPSTDPAKFSSAITVVSPYLTNPAWVNRSSHDEAHELVEATGFLIRNAHGHMVDDESLTLLNNAAVQRWIDVSLGSGQEYLSRPGMSESIGRKIISHVMGVAQPNLVDELWFSRCFDSFKVDVMKRITAPGVVGNIMASSGKFDLSAMRKADKRAAQGRFTQSDVQMLRPVAAQYRPAVSVIARYQAAMGWTPTTWDPVTALDNLC